LWWLVFFVGCRGCGLGGRGCSWFTCSFQCPVRFRRYLFVILMISSSTIAILVSLCRGVIIGCNTVRIFW
jgi:hypothetical protein